MDNRRLVATVALAAVLAGCSATASTPRPITTQNVPEPTPYVAGSPGPVVTPAPTPSPTPAPTAAIALKFLGAVAPTTVLVGSAIDIRIEVKNIGKRRGDVTFQISGLDGQTFVGCKPSCSEFNGIMATAAPAPGKTIVYHLLFQAVQPGRTSVYLQGYAADPDATATEWSFDLVVLI